MGAFDDLIPGGNVTVSAGKSGVSSAEAKTAEGQGALDSSARSVLNSMAMLEAINRRVPGGRFATTVRGWESNLPTGWQTKDIPLFQLMQAEAQSAVMPTAEMYAGKPLGASQMNTEAEFRRWENMVPNPRMEAPAVTARADQLANKAAEQIARSAFMKTWRDRAGSTNRAAPDGRLPEQAFADFVQSRGGRVMQKPLAQYVTEAERRRKGAAAVPADVDNILKRYGVR